MKPVRLFSLFFLLAVGACGPSADEANRLAEERDDSLQKPMRRELPLSLDTAWKIDGAIQRQSVRFPVGLTLTQKFVVVMDAGLPGLIAYHRTSGAEAWRRTGVEWLSDPRAIGALSDGGMLVVGANPNALHRLDDEGNLVSSWPSASFGSVTSLCEARDGSVLMTRAETDTVLYSLDLKSHAVRGVEYPISSAANTHSLVRQGRLTDDRDQGCAFLATLGGRFAVLGSRLVDAEYIEAMPGVRLKRAERKSVIDGKEASIVDVNLVQPTLATMSGSVDGRCLRVLFEGRTSIAGRVLDEYDMTNGKYLSSLVLPSRMGHLRIVGDTIFSLARRQGFPMVLRLTMRAPGTRCNPQLHPSSSG